MRTTVFVAAFAGLIAVPNLAAAQDQPWLKDRRYTEGPGFLVGDFELHPGVALDFGYDSNYQRLSSNPNAALRFRITPSFYFSTLSAQRTEAAASPTPPNVVFRGGVNATYNEFIPVGNGSANEIQNQRNIGGAADLTLQLFPGHVWGANLDASYTRALTASVDSAASGFNSGGTLNRDVVGGGGEIVWTPGAGLLEWRLGDEIQGTLFEDSTFQNLNSVNNTVSLRGRWRFLPRTSLVFDGKFGYSDYGTPSGDYEKFNSHPVRAQLGVNGLVTQSFAVLAMVGWGSSFYTRPAGLPSSVVVQDFDSAIGQAELRWFVTPNVGNDMASASALRSTIAVGFTRDFVDSYIGSTYYERDRGYLNLSYMYGGRFMLVVDGGAGPIVFPELIPTSGTGTGPMAATTIPSFTDIRIDASVFAEYRFKDYFGLNATFRYNQNIDPNNVVIVGQQLLAFTEVEAYIGARWMM